MVLVVGVAAVGDIEELVVNRIIEGIICFEAGFVTYDIACVVANHVGTVTRHAPQAHFVDCTLEFVANHQHGRIGAHRGGAGFLGLEGVVDVDEERVGCRNG